MFYSLLSLQILTLTYHQVTTRFDLFPFNGVRHYSVAERKKEALINGILMSLAIVFTLTNKSIFVGIGGFTWTLFVVGAILSWWVPYFTGRSVYQMPNNETWSQVYERIFAGTIQIMPHFKNNPRPNLEHIILHILIVCSAVFSWVYAFNS